MLEWTPPLDPPAVVSKPVLQQHPTHYHLSRQNVASKFPLDYKRYTIRNDCQQMKMSAWDI
eukprot:2929354-Amphidinium_carterae.1